MAMEISNYYNNYANSYTNTANSKKQETEKTGKTRETAETGTTRKTAKDELSYLSKKFSNYSFVSANYTMGMRYGSNATTNVAISPQFLEKMANDPELEKEYEKQIAGMRKCDEEFIQGEAAIGWSVVAQGWAIDKDGGISGWVITRKDSNAKSHLQTMSENAEKIRKENEEKKKEKVKIEEKRQEEKEELKKLQEKMEELGKEKFGDKWKGVTVTIKEDENVAVSHKTGKSNTRIGLNMDIKA